MYFYKVFFCHLDIQMFNEYDDFACLPLDAFYFRRPFPFLPPRFPFLFFGIHPPICYIYTKKYYFNMKRLLKIYFIHVPIRFLRSVVVAGALLSLCFEFHCCYLYDPPRRQ